MKRLNDLLYKIPLQARIGPTELWIADFFYDSREVIPESLFVAVRGYQNDGHQYITQAIEAGAIAILCETIPPNANPEICWIVVSDSALALAILSANFYGNAAERLTITGVTGTNGKTTTATVLYQLFTSLGYTCGLISTIECKIGEATLPATHTTPDPKQLHRLFQ
ncbi:MAG: Mur ligase family protein, partial [Bacteroidia bacterium]|nr:Mur ligase family protein [Bacteroidia bacterium]